MVKKSAMFYVFLLKNECYLLLQSLRSSSGLAVNSVNKTLKGFEVHFSSGSRLQSRSELKPRKAHDTNGSSRGTKQSNRR